MRLLPLKPPFFVGAVLGAPAAVLICIGISGFFLERELTSNLESGFDSSPVDTNRPGASTAAAISRLHDLAKISSPTERKRELVLLIDGIEKHRLIDLIDETSKVLTGRKLDSARELMFVELARIDPNLALEKVLSIDSEHRSDLIAVVFEAWSESDLETALHKANEIDGLAQIHALRSIFARRDSLSDNQLLVIAERHGNKPIAERVINESNARLLMDEPEEAIKQVLSDTTEDVDQLDLLVEVASLWIIRDGNDALVPMFQALDDAYESSQYSLHWRLIEKVVEVDPQGAWDALLTLSPEIQEQYCRAVLGAWIAVDPIQAFGSITQLSDAKSHQDVQISGLRDWSKEAPYELLSYVTLLRQELRANAIGFAIDQIARYVSIESALEQLNRLLVQGEDTRRGIESLVDTWMVSNAEEAAKWILKSSGLSEYPRNYQTRRVLQHLALQDPSRAMDIALSQPIDEISTQASLEEGVIHALAGEGRFEEATTLLGKVRESARPLAIRSLGMSLVHYDRTDNAVQLALELSETARRGYFEDIVGSWYYANPAQLVEWLASFPDKELKASLSQIVLRQNQFQKDLTKDQVEQLEKHLEGLDNGA